jgi:hypothetical protein
VFKALPVAFAVLLLSTALQAQGGGNIYFGYSYGRADAGIGNTGNLNGWHGSLEGKVLPWVGIVADLSGQYGSQGVPIACPAAPCPQLHASTSVHSFLFGPRASVSVGKFRPFAHVLIGAARSKITVTGNESTDTSFATAIGGGLDYEFLPVFGWRVQADDLRTSFFHDDQSDFRLSTGIVLRF